MNTALATGDLPLGPGFLAWREFVATNPDLDVAKLMARACDILSPEECAAYAAPFPDKRYKAGVRRFPQMVADHPDAEGAELSRRARRWWNTEWDGETFMAMGMQDPVLGTSRDETFARADSPLSAADGSGRRRTFRAGMGRENSRESA